MNKQQPIDTPIQQISSFADRSVVKSVEKQLQTFNSAQNHSLVGLTRSELSQCLASVGVPPNQLKMRLAQLWNWIYFRGARDFSDMTNIAKDLRQKLNDHFTLKRPEIVTEQLSKDGTRKWLLRMPPVDAFDKGAEIECVYIPETDRGTLCISSQVGCTMTCTFCHTGTQPWVRNLSSAEIAAQFMVARDCLGEWPGANPPDDGFVPSDGGRYISNVVFMGMGEPLFNLDQVIRSIDILSDNEGIALSRRRITVSTSGVAPQIPELGERANPLLAISLHAVRNDLRNKLVPLNKRYPIEDLLTACRSYPGLSNARRITFEYVMLKDINDSDADARELIRLLKGIPAKINLIPFNPWPGTVYECSDWSRIERFSEIIFNAGYASPVRSPRGRDILAACGQLKSATEKMRASVRLMLETGMTAEEHHAAQLKENALSSGT